MSTTTSAPEKRQAPRFSLKGFDYQEYGLVGVVILILIVGGILESSFLTEDNMLNVLRQGSVVGCLAIGMTFVIATAGIDLSVGSMVAATGIAGGLLVEHGHGSFGFVVGAVLLAVALGSINGAAVAWGRVPPFIATLAMLLTARGMALWMSGKEPISLFDSSFLRWFGTGEVLTIPSALIV